MPGNAEGKARRLRPSMVSLRLLVLDFVHEYIAQWRNSPSLGEIAAAVGVDRKQAHRAVVNLADSGLLIKIPGPRGLRLPRQRDEAIKILRALGWNIDDVAAQATNRPLMEGPAIDYTPPTLFKRGVSGSGEIKRIKGGWGT